MGFEEMIVAEEKKAKIYSAIADKAAMLFAELTTLSPEEQKEIKGLIVKYEEIINNLSIPEKFTELGPIRLKKLDPKLSTSGLMSDLLKQLEIHKQISKKGVDLAKIRKNGEFTKDSLDLIKEIINDLLKSLRSLEQLSNINRKILQQIAASQERELRKAA